MKTLLILAPHPELAQTIRAGLNSEQYRVIHRAGIEEAEPLLAHGLAHACIVDVELAGVQEIWILEKLRRRAAKIPVIIYAGQKQLDWEEQAYLQGVTHVLSKPVRIRVLTTVLERIWAGAPAPAAPSAAGAQVLAPDNSKPATPPPASPSQPAYQSLGALRGFSAILTHSLDSDAMLKQFLLLLRELIGINRAAVFLRQPASWLGGSLAGDEARSLRVACALGLSPGLLEHFELSFESGIGGQVARLGRILRRYSEEARTDIESQKEFELLGVQVAVPILDRETVIGVAVFDGHITGEPLANGELELIFHLLEQLGLAVKNIWLHEQLAGSHSMLSEILRELPSACVVISRELTVLHANKAARRFFGISNKRTGEMEFSDLPQLIGSKVYTVLKTGSAIPTFRFEPEPDEIYSVTIVPFQRQRNSQPTSALLMVEDLSQSEQLRRLEIETANLRLVGRMADRLAHEIGNAMVPLSTHQQLLAEKYADPEFRASLDSALADSVKRVMRLISQMRFLAREKGASREAFPVHPLITEAYEEARKHHSARGAEFNCEDGSKPITIMGDRAALKHALIEVLLNALQANPAQPKIGVRIQTEPAEGGAANLKIEVQDNGAGFTPEAVKKASSPFFTTRSIGLGLGLAVSRKIIELHRGKLEIVETKGGQAGVVRISLPVELAGQKT